MAHSFELVVFDVGSVLVQAGRTWLDDFARAGIEVSDADWAVLEPRLQSLPHRSTGEITSEAYLPLFAEASGGAYTVEDARRIRGASLGEEYPGISRVFDALDVAQVRTAALCNVNDYEWARLFPEPPAVGDFPTLARIPARFGSHLLGLAKPDPRIYREVERGTGCAGETILFFDDRAENVEAARVCGWTAEVIDHTTDTAEQMLGHLRRHGIVE